MHNNEIETMIKIWEVNKRARVVFESFVKKEMQNEAATRDGQRRNMQTSTYHQWRYSFKKRKKFHTKKIVTRITVRIPMVTAPHLIGKQPQQDKSLVNSVAHTHMQQQHSSGTLGE